MEYSKVIGLIFLFCLSNTIISAQAESYTEPIPGTEFSIDMVLIPPGKFQMGSPEGEAGRDDDEALSAELSIPAFYMSVHEITYDQFLPFRDQEYDGPESASEHYSVDAITRPSPPYLDFTYGMGSRGGFPAVSMTQQAALRYCQWLYKKTGHFYRLPTEAEWEYACRAGTQTPYYFGDDPEDLAEYGWYFYNSMDKYQKVGQKEPNAWGLYDMLGNVAEYTADQYQKDRQEYLSVQHPDQLATPIKGKYGRVVKGGAYDDDPEACRCAARIPSQAKWQARDPQIPKSIWWNPDSPFVGFRIVKPLGAYTEAEVDAYFKKAIID